MVRRIALFTVVMMLASVLMASAAFAQERMVSLTVQDRDIKEVFDLLANLGGKNVLVDDSVTGKVTIRLNNVSFNSALDMLARTKGLAFHVQNDTILVTTMEKAAKTYSIVPTRVVRVQNIPAEEAKKSLELVVPSERIKVDVPGNSLVMNVSDEEFSVVQRALADVDKARPQVILEAQILETTKDLSDKLGLDWTYGSTVTGSLQNPINVKLWGGNKVSTNANATINALISDKNTKQMATPKVVALDGQKAEILIGQELPYPVKDKDGNITINYTQAGIKLQMTPKINDNGLITFKLHTELSTPVEVAMGAGLIAYKKDTTQSDTTVWVQDGGMIVIGGLKKTYQEKEIRKNPSFLAAIPLVGEFFKNKVVGNNEKEVIIIITPKIVKIH